MEDTTINTPPTTFKTALTRAIAHEGITAAAALAVANNTPDEQFWLLDKIRGWDNPDKLKAIAVFQGSESETIRILATLLLP